ncbi:4Fe-4S dicluster domain-containing protein [archaeon]|nr:4Fe-4S dicluster domain-containing protein [archaeon]
MKLLKEILRALTRPPVTTQYPAKPASLPPSFRGPPDFDDARCIRCFACSSVCPTGACYVQDISDGERTVLIIDYTRCISCGRCVTICPTDALHHTREYSLLASRKTLYTLSSTEVDVRFIRCTECNQPITDVSHIRFIADRLSENLPEEVRDRALEDFKRFSSLCPACRTKLARKLGTSPEKWC